MGREPARQHVRRHGRSIIEEIRVEFNHGAKAWHVDAADSIEIKCDQIGAAEAASIEVGLELGRGGLRNQAIEAAAIRIGVRAEGILERPKIERAARGATLQRRRDLGHRSLIA